MADGGPAWLQSPRQETKGHGNTNDPTASADVVLVTGRGQETAVFEQLPVCLTWSKAPSPLHLNATDYDN